MSRARDVGSSINSTAAGKNLVINGGFDFWQRTGTPGTPVHSGAGAYVADRWTPHQFQEGRVSRVSISAGSGPSSQYGIRIGSSTSASISYGTRMVTSQKIESLNTIPLRGKRVTLSFWIRFSNSNFASSANSTDSTYGNFGYMIGYHTTTTDAANSSTALDSYTNVELANTNSSGSLPTSWTKVVLSSTVPNNANNILVRFGFGALGSSATLDQYWYEISDVQLEQGSSATSFSLAGGDFQGELAKCQRYFEKSYNYDVAIQSNTTQGISSSIDQAASATLTNGAEISFRTPKRIPPTIVTYRRDGSATNANYWQLYIGPTGSYLPVLVDAGSKSNRAFIPYFSGTSGLTANNAYSVIGHWTADSEI
jgi:hypothetical protein